MKKYLLVSALSLLMTAQTHAERAETVVQQNNSITKSVISSPIFLGTGSQSFPLNVPEIKIDLTPSTTGIFKSGAIYHFPAPVMASQFAWERVSGGYVARIKLTSGQAKGLRYHLVFNQEIPAIKFRLHGNQDTAPINVLDQSAIHDSNVWLPVTDGNQADLEIFVDESVSSDSVFSIDAINVIVADVNSGNPAEIQVKSLGLAKKPESDLACWADDKNYPALSAAANATARIDIIIDATHSGYCTGTLLSDKNGTKTPWLATANHCLADQATANNASFKWFYQATTCKGKATDSRSVTTGGGAQLLWTDFKLEGAFLKLNTPPPKGAVFMGWNTDMHVNDEVWGVHHPETDHTMVSRGTVSNLLQNTTYKEGAHLVNTVSYIDGGVEGGSSGSGLFSIVNGSAYWQGTLIGAYKSNYQLAEYSDFNSYYPNIKQWLAGSGDMAGNAEIDDLYNKYAAYFGAKSGKNFICYVAYTCQNLASGKAIGVHNASKLLYWFDGAIWSLYK